MKIILASKNPPFYENLDDRKSYIKITNRNIIHDRYNEMIQTQNEYFARYFPSEQDIAKISNKFNLNIIDMNTRSTYIEPSNYPPELYSSNFDFWNNVAYAKIIYNDGFIEYCYISARRCDNIGIMKWYFTFTVDVYNTYWCRVYNDIFRNVNFPILISRWHEDRLIFSKEKQVLFFKFLSTQKTSFWNKEKFESDINSKLTILSGITYTPYTEPNNSLIPEADYLSRIYATAYDSEEQPMFHPAGIGFPIILANHTDKDVAYSWLQCPMMYGIPNTYWWIPLINREILTDEFKIDPKYTTYRNAFDDNYIWLGNLITDLIDLPATATYILTPKPVIHFSNIKDKEPSTPLLYNDVAYPIRYRDNYSNNNLKQIGSTLITRDVYRHITGDIFHNTVTIWNYFSVKPEYSDRIPFHSSKKLSDTADLMCDERIDIANNPYLRHFANDDYRVFLTLKYISPTNILYEPKLYDEEFFNYEYSRYGQNSITISPKWYFYDKLNDFDDLLKYKSIFLLGYQFVQPHICILTTGPISGLYKNINRDGSRNLITQFSPQMQTVSDAEKSFLISNRSQLNTGLNNTIRSANYANQSIIANGALNAVTSTSSGAASGFTSGGPVGAVAGAGFSLVSSIFNTARSSGANRLEVKNAQDMYNAKLQDLVNTPNATTDNSSESTYKAMNSYYGLWKFNWISDLDKKKILAYHQQQGYYLNDLVYINPDNEADVDHYLASLATRLFYNFYQIPTFKLLIQNSKIAPEYQDYFQHLFGVQGVTLWHTVEYNNVTYDKVGDYSHENWEISLALYLAGCE